MSFVPQTASMGLRALFFAVFLIGLVAFLWRDRKKMRRHTIIFYRRTQKGIETIDRIAERFPRFWNFYANSGAVISGISMVLSLGTIGFVVYTMVKTQSVSTGPSFILPGLVAENQFNPGVSFIPVEYWVIGVGILMFVHEMSHGIVARIEGFELNSVGWGVMGIIPFAFVEPKGERMLPGAESDQDTSNHWDQGNWKSRIKVLCAGSYANYLVGALFIALALGISSAVTQPSGVIYNAQDGYPAEEAGMNNGTIKSINGQKVSNLKELKNITEPLEVNDTVSIVSSEGNFTFRTGSKEGHEDGYIGIQIYGQENLIKDQFSDYKGFLEWFSSMLWTIAQLNIWIGLFNMLPAKPLDGGWTAEALVEQYAGEEYTKYLDRFSILVWSLVIATLVLTLVGI